MRSKHYSLTEGSIWKGMLLFALPIFLGNVFQQLYNAFDAWCVGYFINDDALAAVIRNELTATEQTAVRLYWFERKKMSQIALITGVSDDAVRKALRRAGKKIYQCLKYVILYDELVGRQDRLPEDFSFKIISCIDGKELIS